jgi:hypothetical protein
MSTTVMRHLRTGDRAGMLRCWEHPEYGIYVVLGGDVEEFTVVGTPGQVRDWVDTLYADVTAQLDHLDTVRANQPLAFQP